MPWKVNDVVSERMRFVVRLQQGERMSDLCREFGISRKTGYKIWQRYQEDGPEALYDKDRRPRHSPNRVAPELEEQIVALRKAHPSWGPKKLRAWLQRRHGQVRWPATSTFGQVLKRHDLVQPKRRRRRTALYSDKLIQAQYPNQLWCADFKGHFRLQNRRYCYPLTITDRYSRYLLGCEALEHTRGYGAKVVFERVFERFGLPQVIRTDNGTPFASNGLWGLSPLSAWWIRLGIIHERIEPAKPQQNGAHERMHRTLKRCATRPAANNILQQQERFDAFVHEYNQERPHEALQLRTPAQWYQPSDVSYETPLPELRYPLHDLCRTVEPGGRISLFGGPRIYIGRALAGQTVGLRELEDSTWLVSFAHLDLGTIDLSSHRLSPFDVSFSASSSEAAPTQVLPMSPV